MNESAEPVQVPGAVVAAIFDSAALLSASWSEDDAALEALVNGMEDAEVRSVLGTIPWVVKFALMCDPATDPGAFVAQLHADGMVLAARGEGVA